MRGLAREPEGLKDPSREKQRHTQRFVRIPTRDSHTRSSATRGRRGCGAGRSQFPRGRCLNFVHGGSEGEARARAEGARGWRLWIPCRGSWTRRRASSASATGGSRSRSASRSSCARARCTASPRGASRFEMRRVGRTTRTCRSPRPWGRWACTSPCTTAWRWTASARDRVWRSPRSRCCSGGTCSRASRRRTGPPRPPRSRSRWWGRDRSRRSSRRSRPTSPTSRRRTRARRTACCWRGSGGAARCSRRRTEGRSWGTCPAFSPLRDGSPRSSPPPTRSRARMARGRRGCLGL